MAQLIERRYATALFELALQTGQMDLFEQEICQLQQIFIKEKELMEILQHPHIVQEEKISLLERIFKDQISKEIVGLLVIMVQKNRQEQIQGVLSLFLDKVQEAKGMLTVVVTSAIPLSEEQKAKLQKKLHTSLQKQIQLQTEVDPTLLGGLVLRVGDQWIDRSIAGELQELNQQLHAIQLV
ncbi:MAG: ATP synthase F1 subunit delta [Epulopiscium sp.]|nr:ATP synthase F1 subunit delta [Candidatus Epulonipiscium sp.]